jgi:protein-tyrosine phosphatase
MMRSEIYWIDAPTPGRLAVMPRPRGGDWLEDEVRNWRTAVINVVVSLLTPREVAELDLVQEKAFSEGQGIEFMAFPIVDRSTPTSKDAMLKLATELANALLQGRNVAIHCRQGLGRAPLVAICVLILAGLDPQTAAQRVSAARGCPVPETVEQERWIAEFVKEALVGPPK